MPLRFEEQRETASEIDREGALPLDLVFASFGPLYRDAHVLAQSDPTAVARHDRVVPPGRIRAESHTLGSPLQGVLSAARNVLDQWTSEGVRGWLAEWSGGRSDWMGLMKKRIREPLARVLGADPLNVVIRSVLTENLATALRVLNQPQSDREQRRKILTQEFLFPGDADVIASELEYQRQDPKSDIIQVRPSLGRGLFRTTDFIDALELHKDEAGVCVFEHQPYLTGQVLDMHEIVSCAKELGYYTIVDFAHSGGVYPLRLADMRPHFGIGPGYKEFLAGPGTSAWMYADMELLTEGGFWLPKGWIGRSDATRFKFGGDYEADQGALRFLRSTPSPILLAMWAAILQYYTDVGGIETVYQQALQRGSLFIEALKAHPDYGRRLAVLTPSDPLERSAEISVMFASAEESANLFQRLADATDSELAIDADTRIAFFDPNKGIMRFGWHPFSTTHNEVVQAAESIWNGLQRLS